jgi:hypothetical protein
MAFTQAEALAPRPAIVFSLAQAERKGWYVDKRPEDLEHAIQHYHAYLDQVPTGGRRADAADALSELEPIAARMTPQEAAAAASAPAQEAKTRVMVTTAVEGAKGSLDGGPLEDMPLAEEVKPGKHHVKVVADGYADQERDFVASQGIVSPLDVPLAEKPALLTLQTTASATVSVDGRPIGSTPMDRPAEVSAGNHFVALTKNGYKAFTREVTLARGKETRVPVELETSGQRKVAWVVLATGVGGLVAAGVFTGLALAAQGNAQNVLDAQARGNIPASDVPSYQSDVSQRDQWRTAAIIAYGASAGVLAAGAALWLFDKPSVEAAGPPAEAPPKPQDQPTKHNDMDMVGVAPWVGPGAAGVVLRGRL